MKRFRDIQGNDAVITALRQMVDGGKIPHALLLHENDGGGAFPIVLAFLQYLYCRNRTAGDACGDCPSCNRIAKLIHPDVHFVFPVAGSDKPVSGQFLPAFRELALQQPYFYENELFGSLGLDGKQVLISVNEARSLLDKLSLSAVEGGYRSVVMYLPEKMNQAAANSLLKMVEEPPENTLFLLITHEPEKVLSTIRSRCLPMRILPLSRTAEAAVHPSGTADETLYLDLFADLMEALLSRDLLTALETGEALAGLESREKQKSFCKFAVETVRGIFLQQQGLGELSALSDEERAFVVRMAGRVRPTFARGAMHHFDRAMLLLGRNVNQKILFTDLVNRLYMIV